MCVLLTFWRKPIHEQSDALVINFMRSNKPAPVFRCLCNDVFQYGNILWPSTACDDTFTFTNKWFYKRQVLLLLLHSIKAGVTWNRHFCYAKLIEQFFWWLVLNKNVRKAFEEFAKPPTPRLKKYLMRPEDPSDEKGWNLLTVEFQQQIRPKLVFNYKDFSWLYTLNKPMNIRWIIPRQKCSQIGNLLRFIGMVAWGWKKCNQIKAFGLSSFKGM